MRLTHSVHLHFTYLMICTVNFTIFIHIENCKALLTATIKVKVKTHKLQVATAAIKLARKRSALKRRHSFDACRSVGPAVEPSTRWSCPRNRPSSVCQAVVSLVRWRRLIAADDHWRTMNIHRLDCTL